GGGGGGGGGDPTGNLILYGFTDQPAASLARSWNRPPAIDQAAGCESKGYDRSQRACSGEISAPAPIFLEQVGESCNLGFGKIVP
ncbi:MAG: hypothetical protein K9N23_07215, partial [Akkermansiaceae bacterium]|nr:hypothetical protein [Akkermansiaceae bacterium]